jgi:O-methyltransferase
MFGKADEESVVSVCCNHQERNLLEMQIVKSTVKNFLGAFGYQLSPISAAIPLRDQNPDVSDAEWEIVNRVGPFTMTPLETVLASIRSAEYISRNRISGDIVECGVWRGGNSMAMALRLMSLDDRSRYIWCYDTYEGMTDPGEHDTLSRNGLPAVELLQQAKQCEEKTKSLVWAYASIEDVRANLNSIDYRNLHFIKGPVEETIPDRVPEHISVLRLDTDWYDSTKHELIHLYPRLATGGILMIDDYGHWTGARKAVDEYFPEPRPFLNRINYTARLMVKP